MSAALVEPLHEDVARETMRHLLLPGQLKLHWRDENPRRQHAIAAMIATLPIEHLIVVTTHHDAASRAERRRRITLQHLLPELTLLGHADPLLWIPDAACGVTTALRCGDARHFASIEHKVTLHELPA